MKKSSRIEITDISKSSIDVVVGNRVQNAPVGTRVGSESEPLELTIKNLNEVTAKITRGDDISYTENNFQTVMYLLEEFSKKTLEKRNAKEVEQIVAEIKLEKSKDQFDLEKINELLGHLNSILSMATIAPAVIENIKNLLQSIPKFF